jgi:hypothetical protein
MRQNWRIQNKLPLIITKRPSAFKLLLLVQLENFERVFERTWRLWKSTGLQICAGGGIKSKLIKNTNKNKFQTDFFKYMKPFFLLKIYTAAPKRAQASLNKKML